MFTEPRVFFIQDTVATRFGISREQLLSRRRMRHFAYPRMMAMYLVREVLGMSYSYIGEQFGGMHHTTVMHACKWAADNQQYKVYIKSIIERLRDGKE